MKEILVLDQTEKRPPARGSRGLLRTFYDLGLAIPAAVALFSVALSVLLVIARLVEVAAIAAAFALIITTFLLRYRAVHRLKDRRYKKMRQRLETERRFTRFWLAIGVSVILSIIALPPLLAMLVAAGLVSVLLLTALAVAKRSAKIEKNLELAKANAAEECDHVREFAETAASIPMIRAPEYITRLAHYEVAPGEIGILPFLALAVVAIVLFVYVGLALAVGVSEVAQKDPSPKKTAHPPNSPPQSTSASMDPPEPLDPAPTYAEECPAKPDPLAIGHGLGELFRRDGAFKAGCGTKALRVRETGTWVAAGICEGTTRSVAVTAPGRSGAILYGEAADFAWNEAMDGNLVAAEVAEAGGGEVDLVETREGTYAFTRLNAAEGDGEARSCGDVTGTDRPFAHMPPQMVLLWLQLLEYRAGWSWPTKEDATAPEAVAFTAYGTDEVTARGSCDHEQSCRLLVDGIEWPGSGTSFVRLVNLRPYMPGG